jgi:serine/threonine protein kinase
MRFEPGYRFGRYEIRSSLGAGAMGEVFRAYDPRLDRVDRRATPPTPIPSLRSE